MRTVARKEARGGRPRARRPWGHAAAVCAILWLPVLLAGCGSPQREPTVEKFVETRQINGTWVTVTLITGNGKQAVAASDAAFACLDSVNAFRDPAGGGIDTMIEGSALDAAAVRVMRWAPGVRADLRSLAQSYAVDRAVAAIRREGVVDGIVQIGDKLRCCGAIPAALVDQEAVLPVRTLRSRPVKRPAGGAGEREAVFEGLRRSEGASPADPRPWRIELPNPFAEHPLGRIPVGDQAIATLGAAGEAAAVAVLAATALEADGLAQAVAALGAQRGLALAESLPDAEALIVTGGAGTLGLVLTSGFPALESVPVP